MSAEDKIIINTRIVPIYSATGSGTIPTGYIEIQTIKQK